MTKNSNSILQKWFITRIFLTYFCLFLSTFLFVICKLLKNTFFKFQHNAEYEPIIESSLNEMNKCTDENTIFLVIIYTLTMVYEDIIDKHNVVDINTEEAKKLKVCVV